MKPIVQHGVALISAIFILLVLATLGAFAVTISTTQHLGSAQDIQSARARQAALAGLEWGEYRLRIDGVCAAGPTDVPVPLATTMADFTVSVVCTGAGPHNTITATACNQPTSGVCPNTTNPTNLYIETQQEDTV